ncbi:DUF488 domain-containing protein [Aquibaculum arenosum]|uniref:DUF488 family protein n=1 Tax=Aquibaculum arenosum TaxID=3032591 RepID=A0ABT5YQ11_9PROT|nr:DUF488 family protein [Fodinicurvata sp. CAU 1616]MDF2096918.1 DUF488 family protein [Fodinicurvata sp. CAU 1616]
MSRIHLKRVYDPAAHDDGLRVLVDRLWPRGVSKERAAVDHWAKDLAPSSELRRWFHRNPEAWDAFFAAYRAELSGRDDDLRALQRRADQRPITLLYAARDRERNHARILSDLLEGLD